MTERIIMAWTDCSHSGDRQTDGHLSVGTAEPLLCPWPWHQPRATTPPWLPRGLGAAGDTSRAAPAAAIPGLGTVLPGSRVPCGCRVPGAAAAGIERITGLGTASGASTEQRHQPRPAKPRQSLSQLCARPCVCCAANTKAMRSKPWDTALAELRGQTNTQGTKTPSAPAELDLSEEPSPAAKCSCVPEQTS